jgi:5-formyltetrahydrofolate cyclo-ligase
MSAKELKRIIREKILSQRNIVNPTEDFFLNKKLIDNVNDVMHIFAKDSKHAGRNKKLTAGFYWPVKGEPDLLKLVINKNWSSALPKIRGVKMDFVRYNLGDQLEVSCFAKLMQPENNIKIIPDIVIVPGLAYSMVGGYRLGFGKGNYDRYFAQNAHSAAIIKIGVCFHEYLWEYLPHEPHDIKMDYIITEQTIISL